MKKTNKKGLVTKELPKKKKRSKKVDNAWQDAPNHVEVGGVTYEKIDSNTVQLELELDPDTIENIKRGMDRKLFVSDLEYIRHLLRSVMVNEKRS